MDMENIWQQGGHGDDALNRLLEKGHFNRLQSGLPFKKIKSNLLTGMAWALLVTAGYIVVLFFFPLWEICIALGVLILFNTLIMIESWKLYRKMPSAITPSNSLKQELTLHCKSLQRWWSVQQKISLFVYPIAVAGGFILGGFLGSGKPVESFLYNSKMLGILGITILTVVPICYFGARWIFNYAYGKYLRQLKATIDDLE
jgi:hypothetical protein